MFSNAKNFADYFVNRVEMLCGKSFNESAPMDHYKTLGKMIREYLSRDWIETNERYRVANEKQVYYFSIEFLPGRLLRQNLINLGIENVVEKGLAQIGISLEKLEELETDPALGNGGLGRLAACFLDSLATLNLPGHGMGIRYKYGLFEQRIIDGYQVELPEQWLRSGHVWEVRKDDHAVEVPFWGRVETSVQNGRLVFHHVDSEKITAVPYDMPVAGFQSRTVNTLRLWSAEPSTTYLSRCQDIMKYKRETESVTEFLYPDDTHDEGKILRLKQQYFLVSAGLQSIVASYRKEHKNLLNFPDHVAIHINDTHPVLAIPELMRIFIDEEHLDWDTAWDLTTKTISYTNHTTLAEALEKWPFRIFAPLLPRIYMIVHEINERFCRALWERYPGDWKRIEEMAIISHGLVKMAHLAIAGSHSINGVAKLHTDILKKREMKLFYEFTPEKFNNKTNGITHRRWLCKANKELSGLITEAIGDSWVYQPEQLKELEKFKTDSGFLTKLSQVKRTNKEKLAELIKRQTGMTIDCSSIFDIQVKRLHAYKRQLLNILHILHLYNKLKTEPSFQIYPRTFIFGAKASPGYYYAKKIIKLINSVAEKVNHDPDVRDQLKIIFLENYRVSVAERVFPAADVSEQISTASKEASGTGNMKFMMNGAITVGTLDGANVEIREKVGDENIFIFGLTADEVINIYESNGYRSAEYYYHDLRIREICDQLINGFLEKDPGEFEIIYDSLLVQNDQYFVLKDFDSYAKVQEKVAETYQRQDEWQRMSLVNIANSGYFSSDRTIREYAGDIWDIKPSRPMEFNRNYV